jgi:hypothetical protein
VNPLAGVINWAAIVGAAPPCAIAIPGADANTAATPITPNATRRLLMRESP